MQRRFKEALFLFVFTILLLPLLQYNLPVIKSGPLYGFYTRAKDTTWSPEDWMDGTYQSAKSAFINDHVGFRPDFVRLQDQLEFSLFSKPVYGGAVICRGNCLLYDNYIDTRYGRDFIGYETITRKLEQLKAIQDTLGRLGKTFVLIFNPSKADYYGELIPGNLKDGDSEHTNYKTFLHISDSLDIHHIDLNAWFLAMKSKTKDAIFTKRGIHWTYYGSLVAGDSIVRYIEHARNMHMHHPLWTKVRHTTDARLPDNDMDADLNLIYPVSNDVFSYPEVFYSKAPREQTLNAIFIGDSFIMNMVKSQLLDSVFDNWQYWFYMRLMCNRDNYEGYGTNPKFPGYDWKPELAKTDCIIIMYTAIGLKELGNGFIEQAYDYYYPKGIVSTK